MKSATPHRIIECASQLFFTEGFATGVDRIVADCGIAKMSLYAHFRSKDGLICAVLHAVQAALTDKIKAVTDEPHLTAGERREAVFNLLSHAMSDPHLRLGLGVRALLEFPQPRHPVHLGALALDRLLLKELGGEPDGSSATESAPALLLIIKGCFLMSPMLGVRPSQELARALGKALLTPSAKLLSGVAS